jgi:ABC-type Zn uptake system ZnuABC Zn-binding protein ZnuA
VEQVPEVTPSPKQMGRLLKAIREQHARALFTEPGGSSRLARQIAADAKIKPDELDPLETGALQPDSYEKTMRRNAEALVRALR